jgi:hypothetical protein
MSQSEKQWIARIQLSQLANDPSFIDDYYHQSLLRKQKQQENQKDTANSASNADAPNLPSGLAAALIQDKSKFQDLLEQARARNKPKVTQSTFSSSILSKIHYSFVSIAYMYVIHSCFVFCIVLLF